MKGKAFSAEMAQAIYEGRKTMFREIMEPQPDAGKMRWNGACWEMHMGYPLGHDVPLGKYSIGERLYVQEPFIQLSSGSIFYEGNHQSGPKNLIWRLEKTMTHDQARSIIEITGIRVERLQDITEEDAKAEGAAMKIDPLSFDSGTATCTYRYGFYDIWQNIYPDHPIKGWDANPWVFTYGVKRVEDGDV